MFPAGEGSSDNSDDSTAKKHTADLTTPFDKPYVDTWRPEYDQKFYRQSADYDELNYPSRVGVEIYSWKIQYLVKLYNQLNVNADYSSFSSFFLFPFHVSHFFQFCLKYIHNT